MSYWHARHFNGFIVPAYDPVMDQYKLLHRMQRLANEKRFMYLSKGGHYGVALRQFNEYKQYLKDKHAHYMRMANRSDKRPNRMFVKKAMKPLRAGGKTVRDVVGSARVLQTLWRGKRARKALAQLKREKIYKGRAKRPLPTKSRQANVVYPDEDRVRQAMYRDKFRARPGRYNYMGPKAAWKAHFGRDELPWYKRGVQDGGKRGVRQFTQAETDAYWRKKEVAAWNDLGMSAPRSYVAGRYDNLSQEARRAQDDLQQDLRQEIAVAAKRNREMAMHDINVAADDWFDPFALNRAAVEAQNPWLMSPAVLNAPARVLFSDQYSTPYVTRKRRLFGLDEDPMGDEEQATQMFRLEDAFEDSPTERIEFISERPHWHPGSVSQDAFSGRSQPRNVRWDPGSQEPSLEYEDSQDSPHTDMTPYSGLEMTPYATQEDTEQDDYPAEVEGIPSVESEAGESGRVYSTDPDVYVTAQNKGSVYGSGKYKKRRINQYDQWGMGTRHPLFPEEKNMVYNSLFVNDKC